MDLPWRGHRVRLRITVRRFRCLTADCPRFSFAEALGPLVPRHAQRTVGATALLVQFAQRAGGEAGARLATAAGGPVSPDTLLRLLRQQETAESATPRLLGVDDFALRRGGSATARSSSTWRPAVLSTS